MPSSSTSSASRTQVEIMELKAQEAQAALEAIRARRMLAEARSSQASTQRNSRAPSVAAPEVEHFDIADPEERNNDNNMHDPVIEHGEVVLPLAAETETHAQSRVDQLREFWSSLSRPDSPPRASIPLAATPPPAHPADDARDKKIEELRKQLQDLEQRTRPTRTSPDAVTHAKNFDFDQLNSNSKPTIQEVMPPPGLKSVYGTPQGSDRGEEAM